MDTLVIIIDAFSRVLILVPFKSFNLKISFQIFEKNQKLGMREKIKIIYSPTVLLYLQVFLGEAFQNIRFTHTQGTPCVQHFRSCDPLFIFYVSSISFHRNLNSTKSRIFSILFIIISPICLMSRFSKYLLHKSMNGNISTINIQMCFFQYKFLTAVSFAIFNLKKKNVTFIQFQALC